MEVRDRNLFDLHKKFSPASWKVIFTNTCYSGHSSMEGMISDNENLSPFAYTAIIYASKFEVS